MKLLYQYPPKIDRKTAQLRKFNDSLERKKYNKNAVKNVAVALIMGIIAFFIPTAAVKIFVFLLSAMSFFSAYLLYKCGESINSPDNWTKIYEDRIEHSQINVISNKITQFCIKFDDIENSRQNAIGELVFVLKDGHGATVTSISKGRETNQKIKNNSVSISFINSKPKMYLINNMYSQIKYPKKNYNIIEDDEDENDF